MDGHSTRWTSRAGWARRAAGAAVGLFAALAATTALAENDVARSSAADLFPDLPRATVDAACQEGALTLYNSIYRNGAADVIAQFRRRFPCIAVSTFVGTGGALAQRFTSEAKAGNSPADILMNASPSFGDALVRDGLLLPWTPPDADRVPPQWKHDGYWYAVALEEIGVAWNTDDLDGEQKSWVGGLKRWEQLASTPFRDRTAALVDLRAGGSAQLPFFFLRTTFGDGFLRKLAASKPSVFNGINPLVERLAAGEIDLCLIGLTSTFSTQRGQGAPLSWTVPEPALAFPNFASIPKAAPHPNAAKLYLAWSLSPEGQAAWVTRTGLAPANPDVKPPASPDEPAPRPAPGSFYRADWDAIQARQADDLTLFSSLFGR